MKGEFSWKAVSIVSFLIIVALIAIIASMGAEMGSSNNSSNNSQIKVEGKTEPSTSEDIFAEFTGADSDVVQLCELRLYQLGIEYITIDEYTISKTRVGTYELEGILRTPNEYSEFNHPRSTDMLCTIFPGDEVDPIVIDFGKDW